MKAKKLLSPNRLYT